MSTTTIRFRTVLLIAGAALMGNPSHAQTADPPKTWNSCAACHAAGGAASIGPSLVGVLGRKSGSVPDFTYSKAMKSANLVWDEESLKTFLTDPQSTVPGTRMAFPGIPDSRDLAELIQYLKTLK